MPHFSPRAWEFLMEELLNFCRMQFLMLLLPYKAVKGPLGLCLLPIDVVPQQEWQPWVIVDYSFFGINDNTVWLSQHHSLQLGKAQDRFLQQTLRASPKYGPVSTKCVGLRSWQSLIGVMRSLVPGIPGVQGQFSFL